MAKWLALILGMLFGMLVGMAPATPSPAPTCWEVRTPMSVLLGQAYAWRASVVIVRPKSRPDCEKYVVYTPVKVPQWIER